MIINSRFFNRSELIGFVALAAVLFVILPLSLDVFRLNLVAKYLTYAFVAIGLVLCWGYGGILSLGQGVFFGLGGYGMAMFKRRVGGTYFAIITQAVAAILTILIVDSRAIPAASTA